MHSRYHPAVVTAAITGGDVLPSQSPHIPCGAERIVAEAVAAAQAGATCVHIHGRELDGQPSGRPELLAEIAEGIRARCDVVLNFSTGGTPGMSEAERLSALAAARPEIATLNIGTMNYELFPVPDRVPEVREEWERAVVDAAGEGVFRNTLGSIRRFASAFRALGVTPEVEAYDLGHIAMARFLLDQGVIEGPIRLQLVLGVFGGAGNALDDLVAMVQSARRILGADLGSLGVAATGFPMEFRCAATALSWGMDCRVGLEDNLRVTRSRYAESNVELVEVALGLAERLGRPVATPQQLRDSLGPWRNGAAAA
jgi:uncharacterized protein (DUF849 family)